MNLLVKRLYCPYDHRLVRGHEKANNGIIQVTCSICGKVIRVWNGLAWKAPKFN